jgi:DNA-binding response OmpR family regulator
MYSVLIVEDNPAMLRGLQDNFQAQGYTVRTARDGQQGLDAAFNGRPDLIILDVMLPKLNGYELCSTIRKRNLDMPIIMVSAKDQASDVILGLNVGADDYVRKPFSIGELLARAEVFMRRSAKTQEEVYRFGSCTFQVRGGILTNNDKRIGVSPGESRMLQLFLAKPGVALSKDEILRNVWRYSHFMGLRDVDRLVNSLRRKIEPTPDNPRFIHTVGQIGYKFCRKASLSRDPHCGG